MIAGTANLHIQELRLERLVPEIKSGKLSAGTMEGRAQLTGHGNSVAAMLGTSNGHVTLLMDGGEISDLVLRLLNLDIAHVSVTLMRGDQAIPVRCIVGHFVASNGHLQPQPFILDTEHTKVTMEGDIDLRTELLDLRLVAQPKDTSLAALRGPIVLEGPLSAPKVRPDLRRPLARSVAAIALGIVATPVAALVPLFQLGTEKDANCPATVSQAKALIDQQAGAQSPTPNTTGRTRKGAG